MEPSSTRSPRRRALLVAGLLAITALAGGAAREGRRPRSVAPPPAPPPAVVAPHDGPVRVTARFDRSAVHVGGDATLRMELVMTGAAAPAAAMPARRPTDLLVILDRSGSMDGDKIAHARAALRELVGQLGDGDRFALVAYADDAQLVAPLAPATDGARRGWLASVDGIVPGGGTNMSAGLDLALATIAEAREGDRLPRVILISDGLANLGDSSHQGLVARAQRCARDELPLTTVGVGEGFNEYLMSALAGAGTGNYYYVQDATDLDHVFASEFGAARATVASGLAVEIEPGPGVRVVEAAGYPLEAAGDKIVFHPGALFAGQERRIWVTLAVPNHSPAEYALGRCTLAYSDGDVRKTIALPALPRIASVVSADDFFARVDPDLWGRGVVVEDYGKMQHDVARLVKDGRRDQAVATVQGFRQRIAGMNGRLASPEVQRKLESLDALEANVADAFQGAGQRAKQNALSKAGSAAAWDGRRAGSKY